MAARPAAASLAALIDTAAQTRFNISMSDSDAFTFIPFRTSSILYLSWLLKIKMQTVSIGEQNGFYSHQVTNSM